MIIQVNTDSNIEGKPELVHQIETDVEDSLEHYGERITRVEVHLSDENSDKKFGTNAMRCLLEARLSGLQPVAVSDTAANIEQAVAGAVEKLKHSLDNTLGKLEQHEHSGRRNQAGDDPGRRGSAQENA